MRLRSFIGFASLAQAVAVLVTACSPAETGITKAQTGDPVIVLSEGECESTCPVYDMTLHPDGSYILNAVRFVKEIGVTSGNLDPAAWEAAEKVLTDGRFWEIRTDQTRSSLPSCVSGPPVVGVTWRDAAGRQKTVSYRVGCGDEETRAIVVGLRGALAFDRLVYTPEQFAPDGSR